MQNIDFILSIECFNGDILFSACPSFRQRLSESYVGQNTHQRMNSFLKKEWEVGFLKKIPTREANTLISLA